MPAKRKRSPGKAGDASPTVLSAASFGGFESNLKLAFQDAFDFSWDPLVDSPQEAERRRAFAPILAAAHAEPAGPARALELMRDCYELSMRLAKFTHPHEFLRDEFAEIMATVAHVGEDIRRLLSASPEPQSNTNLHAGSVTLREVSDRWSAVVDWLRAEEANAMPNPLATEMTRIRDVAEQAIAYVEPVRQKLAALSLGGQNPVTSAERDAGLKNIGAETDQLCRRLEAFSGKCISPAAEEAAFSPYFERVTEALSIQCTFEPVIGNPAAFHVTEVPEAALVLQRSLAERRRGILQWLCTRDPRFYALLPSAVRRDREAPAMQGGKGKRNVALHGISAALVLLGLVDEVPNTREPNGQLLSAGNACSRKI